MTITALSLQSMNALVSSDNSSPVDHSLKSRRPDNLCYRSRTSSRRVWLKMPSSRPYSPSLPTPISLTRVPLTRSLNSLTRLENNSPQLLTHSPLKRLRPKLIGKKTWNRRMLTSSNTTWTSMTERNPSNIQLKTLLNRRLSSYKENTICPVSRRKWKTKTHLSNLPPSNTKN